MHVDNAEMLDEPVEAFKHRPAHAWSTAPLPLTLQPSMQSKYAAHPVLALQSVTSFLQLPKTQSPHALAPNEMAASEASIVASNDAEASAPSTTY
jgi:hypothetical protein